MTAFKRIRGIAAKDFLEMTRDGRFRWSGAILSMLTLMSIAVGIRTFLDIDRQHRDAQAEARTHWESQGEKNPHAAAHYGMYLFEPKSFLSFIDPGVESFTGVSVFLEAHKQNDAQNRQARDGTSLQRFGEMTAAMVLQTLVPLVIVFLAFPVIVGEREQGTLRFLLSQGVRLSEVAIGKTLGTFAALGLIILPNIGFGVLAILLQFEHADSVTIGRFLALAGFYFVYSAIFLAIAVMASAVGRSSSTVLIALLGFWICNTLIAPRLSADIAAWAIPLPTAFEFDAAVENDILQGIDGHDPSNERLEKLRQELLAKYQVDSVEELPVSFAGLVLQESELYGNRVFDKHYSDLWSKIERQDKLVQRLAFLSPTIAIRSLSMAICGSDTADHLNFTRQAEAYRRNLIEKLNQDLIENGAEAGFSYTAEETLWKDMPEFEYMPRSLGQNFEDQAFSAMSLSCWFAAAIAGAVVMSGRTRID